MGDCAAVSPALSLSALNGLDRGAFTQALGRVFEQSPWVAERAWGRRPFATVAELHAAMAATVEAATPAEQLALLGAHPDLAGRAARAGAMSADSVAEQAAAGLSRLTDEEYERFHRLNTAYRERFGFPFIIAVRRHDVAGILAAFESRRGHTRGEEIRIALAEVADIARLRLEGLVSAA
jgi:2-oxo-4-hydroxy-4-carboxy-5-ureidoimidazoline decarboxylase